MARYWHPASVVPPPLPPPPERSTHVIVVELQHELSPKHGLPVVQHA
jgi:hypothetical protein